LSDSWDSIWRMAPISAVCTVTTSFAKTFTVDLLTSAGRGEEVLDHLQGALVVLDHELEEGAVERDPLR